MSVNKACRLISFTCFFFLVFLSVANAATTRIILRDNVNVRMEPNVNSEIVVRLNSGHKLRELQKKGYWYQVQPEGIGQVKGWVFGSLVGSVEEYQKKPDKKGGVVVAQMGDDILFEEELDSFLSLLDTVTRKKVARDLDLLKSMVREEIVRKKIIQDAIEQGFDRSPRMIHFMERARTQALADHFLRKQAKAPDDFPSDKEIKEVYERTIEKYTTPQMVHVAQIFIYVPTEIEDEQRKELQDQAQKVADLARFDGDGFNALAAEYSEHLPTAQVGGDLGWLEESGVAIGMRQVFADMEKGSVSMPYRSEKGWHIFKLLDRQKSRMTPLSEVAGEIRENLRLKKMIANRDLYLKNLIEKNEISIDEATLQGKIEAEGSFLSSQP